MIKAYSPIKSKNFSLIKKLTFLFAGMVITFSAWSCAQCDSSSQSAFIGTWKVARMVEVDEGEPGPEGTETSYPDTLIITCDNKLLFAKYIDQFGRNGSFKQILDNGGNDLILAYSDLKTKDPKSFSIVHRVKVFGDTLQGVTFGRARLFEWRAARLEHKIFD